MNEYFLKLANENFYASADTIRNFFMLGMDNEKAFDIQPVNERRAISEYGTEYNTIHIKGMMVREPSILTDIGWATSTEMVIDGIKESIAEGKKVKLLVNSGGGMVSGTSNLADIIYENRDSIEAYGTGVIASAAMWVFSSAGKRYAEPTSVMGSIGVVTSVLDDEQYWKSYGIIWKEIVSENAKNKRPDVKTEEGQKEVKRYLTSLETVFIDTVSRNLDMSREDVISKFHEGGLITGSDALKLSVIDALTSYDTLASMPSAFSAEKIVKKSNTGDDVMKVTQEDLDAVTAKLDEANASVTALSAEKQNLANSFEEATSEIQTLKAELDEVNSKIESAKDIISMAFEHKVDKATAIKMLEAGSKAEAALVVLSSKQSNGASAVMSDIDETIENDSNDSEDEDEEAKVAMEIAKKISVNYKK